MEKVFELIVGTIVTVPLNFQFVAVKKFIDEILNGTNFH